MNRKDRIKKNLPFFLIFITGLIIFAYPLISQKYYEIESEGEVVEFKKESDSTNKEEIAKRMDLARAYNRTLDPARLADPFTQKEKKGRAEYARMLEINEMLGHVEIPKIGQDLPIYAGTSDEVLEKGCGHLEGTSLPIGGNNTHTVITGHRGLPNAKLFRNLDQLVEGDVFYIHNIEDTLAYQVDKIQVVDPSDFQPVLVEEGHDYATLLTCTPYMINSHRLLVRGHRIPYQAAIDDGVANTKSQKYDFFQLFLIMLPLVVLLIIFVIKEHRRRSSLRNEVNTIEESIKTYKK
ncbi:class C sortase [Anaerococcus sp.]|uniref:class C sortase n=1 Tax=Anaerococcus sp. TaxID=1872515 RepID=UPI00258BB273|nr:class C sortase [Anaerococcus sp.]MDU1828748.1 class C sortase [Anaerococcus sp.]MDU1863868.1 class C sortase [Anaerococcus sp.]MDU3212074.1 class C sortase [Anaerococcus sp.]